MLFNTSVDELAVVRYFDFLGGDGENTSFNVEP